MEYPLVRSDLIAAIERVTRRIAAGEPVTMAGDADALRLVEAAGWSVERGGRRQISATDGLVVGLDLGGTKLRGAIGNAAGDILHEIDEPTVNAAPDHAVGQMAAMVAALAGRAGIAPSRLATVAVGVPGVVRPDGRIAHSPNVPFTATTPIGATLERMLGAPVDVENDGNLSALGEYATRRLETPALSDLAFLALGTGIGMGLVSGGKLLRGVGGAAGEIAFLPFGRDAFAAAKTEPSGAYEAAVGSVGLAAAYQGATGKALKVHEIFAAANSGDAQASSLIAELVDNLALGLGAVVALLDPGLVVLGGGIGARPEMSIAVAARLKLLVPNEVLVVPSALGDRAGVIGALSHALDGARARLMTGGAVASDKRATA
jgi:glucokinase